MASTERITSDYEGVSNTITKMDNELEEILVAVDSLTSTVNNTDGWQGVDAIAYKSALRIYGNKIKNCSRYLKSLDKILSRHSYRLYQRALRNANASRYD